MLKMDLEYQSEILFVRLKGTLNRKTTYKIHNYLVPVLAKHKIKEVVFNLANLKSIDESGIDAILHTKCTVKKYKGKIYLCEVNKMILLKVKRLHIKTLEKESEVKKIKE